MKWPTSCYAMLRNRPLTIKKKAIESRRTLVAAVGLEPTTYGL
jgi:hypothetical protein